MWRRVPVLPVFLLLGLGLLLAALLLLLLAPPPNPFLLLFARGLLL
jgi:hypothetical protein